MRLREALVIYMFPLLVLPTVLFGYVAYHYSTQANQQEAFYHVSRHLNQQQQLLHQFFSLRQQSLAILSRTHALRDYLQQTDTTQAAAREDALRDELKQFLGSHTDMLNVRLLKLNGEFAFSEPIMHDADVASTRLRNQYFSQLQIMLDDSGIFIARESDQAPLRIILAQKVYQKHQEQVGMHRLWGYLVASIDVRILEQVTQNKLLPGNVNLLINGSGTIAYAERSLIIGSVFAPTNFKEIQRSVGADSLQPVVLLGKPMLLLGAPLPAGFMLLSAVRQDELSSLQSYMPMVWFIGSLFFAMLLPLICYRLLMRYVFDPIKVLTEAKTAVGKGDLSTLLPVVRQDELGDIFAAFNVMVRQLRVYRERERINKQQLEDKVTARTKDLAQANQDLAQANRELTHARESAEQANRLKSVFLANMSHEIRTPLTAIIGFSEQAMAEDTDKERQQDYLQRVLRSGDHLLRLINDILDLSKIEAEKLELTPQLVNLQQLLDDIFLQTKNQATAKGLQAFLELAYPLPQFIIADELRFRQVLLNLTSNALKFTQRGKIIIHVSFEVGTERLSIKIKDSGIGMTPEELSKLFQPFVQADATVTRNFGGTGLGLVISKKLMQQMHGDIQVESVKGIGSCFELSMNCETQHLSLSERYVETAAPAAATEAPECIESLRILVAEDNPDNQLLVSVLLRKINAQFEIVENGQLAVQKLLANDYDLVFMDMQMPEMGGEEATRLVRHAGIDVPIIALTANVMREDQQRYLQAGCQALLGKPIVQRDFYAAIQQYAQSQGALMEQAMAQKLAQDPAIVALKEDFTRRLPDLLQSFAILWQQQLWSALQAEAHSLKGCAGSMGYPVLTELAAVLEDACKNAEKTLTHAAIVAMHQQLNLALPSVLMSDLSASELRRV